ncbi:MAG: hypothetical protein E7438_07130 [Ruminococcaceae bacterium]|nr:hypothetical protein [Oscillospiraceae bacterium]
MKKYFALILALALALSLCACESTTLDTNHDDNDTPATTEATVPSEPAEPEIPNLNMFVGTWKRFTESSLNPNESFTLNANGTMLKDGKTYTWTATETPQSYLYEMEISVKYEDTDAFTIRLQRTPDDTYMANFRNSGNVMGSGTDFYRDEDYTVVELTEDNLLDYVESRVEFEYETDKDGYTQGTYRKLYIGFKDTVGYPSYGNANFISTTTYQEVTFDAKPDGYTLGEVKNVYTNLSINGVWLTGGDGCWCSSTYNWSVESGQTNTILWDFDVLTGVDFCSGRVFLLR